MGEQKTCLFCGKRVDRAFEYCPHCGYEFGDDDERLTAAGAERLLFGDRPAPDLARDLFPRSGTGDLPVLVEEEAGECAPPPPADDNYLDRLHLLQQTLAEMERELDRLLAREGRPAEARSPSAGP